MKHDVNYSSIMDHQPARSLQPGLEQQAGL